HASPANGAAQFAGGGHQRLEARAAGAAPDAFHHQQQHAALTALHGGERFLPKVLFFVHARCKIRKDPYAALGCSRSGLPAWNAADGCAGGPCTGFSFLCASTLPTPPMNLDQFNRLQEADATAALAQCCGATE